jgi:hypothetical protein
MIKPIYIFGIHRSGTNYLMSLLNSNFGKIHEKNINNNYQPLWKHSVVVDSTIGDYPTFVIYKNPYTWVESIIKRKQDDGHNIMLASKYLPHYVDENRYIKTDSDLSYYNGKISFERLLNIYRQFHENWILNFPKQNNLFVISYEDLLIEETRNKILDIIGKKFNWDSPNNWLNSEPGTIPLSKDYSHERGEYYLNKKPRDLTIEEIEMIDKIIDEEFKLKLKEKVKEYYV